MPALTLLSIGQLKSGAEADLCAEYLKRMKGQLLLREIVVKSAAAEAESQALLQALPTNGFLIALDERGTSRTSFEFAQALAQWQGRGQPLFFAIGGADGHSDALRARAEQLVALGPYTWPHRLVRVMLLEQIYRAFSILSGHPYHRA